MDQEYEAFIAKNIVSFKHWPLIGMNASDTGLYLGPFFVYFASIPFALFQGNPLGFAITAYLISLMTIIVLYKIGKNMFSQRVGIFAAVLYSGSFLISFYDREFWNPMPIPLFSLLIGYLTYRLTKHHPRNLILLGIILGIAVQCHLSILIFIPVIIYIVYTRRKIIPENICIFP